MDEAMLRTVAAEAVSKNSVGTKERAAFYVAAFFRDMSYAMVSYITMFYIDILGFAGTAALLVVPIVTRVWDGLNDPFLGAYYDRRPHDGEKARPIFKKTALGASVCLVFMFYAPTFSANARVDYIVKIVYAIITYCIFEAFHTLNGTAFMSFYNSISANPNERTKIISISRLFSMAGLSAVSLIPVILGLFRNDDVVAKTYIYLASACVIAICFMVYNILMYRFVHERVIIPAPKKQPIKPILKNFVKNKLILLIICSNIIAGLANCSVINIYFYTYNMGNPGLGTIFGFLTVPTFVVGSLIVPYLCGKFDKRNIMIVCSAAQVLLTCIYIFAGYKPDAWAVIVYGLFGNIPSSIKTTLYWNMVADTIDYGEWKTGFRNDGMVYSIEGCASKIIGAVGGMFTGAVIMLIHYVPNAPTQSDSVMKCLFYIPQAVTIVLTVLATIPFFFYDLDKKKHELILTELQERKELAELEKTSVAAEV